MAHPAAPPSIPPTPGDQFPNDDEADLDRMLIKHPIEQILRRLSKAMQELKEQEGTTK